MSEIGKRGEDRICAHDLAATRAGEDSDAGRSPYRSVPRDFVERWPQFGWGAARDEWRAHSRTIARWVDECGREAMVLARKRYLEAQRSLSSRSRRKRYVMGRTLSPVANRQGSTDIVSAD